ncbi:hypothetical protein ABZ885_27440, partial [Kitasatospora sp. NPDC047058]
LLLAEHPATVGARLDRVVEAVARQLADGHRPYAAALALAARNAVAADRIEALGKLPGASARLRRGLTRALAVRATV